MYKQITVQTLHKQGIKQADIAKQLGCHRNTVRNVIKRQALIEKQTRARSSQLDTCRERIKEWLDQKLTRLRVYEKLKEEYGIQRTYANLCIYIKKHFPIYTETFGVQHASPGEEAELDFGYLGRLPGPDGKLVKTWGLVIVLSYSRAAYYAVCYDQKLDTLCSGIKQALEYFGGVPKRLKVDNMKTAVLRNRKYELDFNQDFLEFANHYNVVIVPCSPYSPEQKGKVEAGVKYLQNNFVAGRTFTSDRDIAVKLTDWTRNYANQRVHGTTRKVPWTEFVNKEQQALQSLPLEEFSLFQRSIRKVGPNCHINFENVYYSVPCQYARQEVTVRWNDNLIRLIAMGEQIALHVRSWEKGTYVTERVHLPSYKIYSETEHQARVEEQMRAIGESAHEYFCFLLTNKRGYWNQSTRAILGLCREYGNEAVNLSLKRALYYKAMDVVTIKHILEKKLYEAEIEPILPKEVNTDSTLARDLTYYSLS